MKPVVFLGPSLARDQAAQILDADFRPPVAQGDVYRAVRDTPPMIGIVDGYFDGVPSVWHKEILWAISRGIPVYGAASMGALRAAELASFGMIGVGAIYQAYAEGHIEDDDEVAVVHAPAELGFKPLSEPMVSLRATLSAAVGQGVVSGDDAQIMLAAAKALHYRDRTWPAVLAAATGIDSEAFKAWLPTGAIDQKRDDAVALLHAMAAHDADAPRDQPAPSAFEWTLVWNDLVARCEAPPPASGDADRRILDELRLDPDVWALYRDRALLRLVALNGCDGASGEVGRDEMRAAMTRHRDKLDLPRRADLAAWLDENGLREADYERLLADRCRLDKALALAPERLCRAILDELKWAGAYAALRTRAEAKEAALAGRDVASVSPAAHLKAAAWYFEQRLGRAMPADADAFARRLALPGRAELAAMLRREHLYVTLSSSDGETNAAE